MCKRVFWGMVCLAILVNCVSAEIIRGINVDFVTIGNAGNPADTKVMTTDGTTGYGSVGYVYKIGKYEITNQQWGSFVGNSVTQEDSQKPTRYITWFETLQFCNYLTSGDKSKGVYQFSGNNSNPGDFLGIDRIGAKYTYGTIYFLPTEDEWYKAAYYKPDGSGYSVFANGSNTIPTADNGWNLTDGAYQSIWNVGTGTMEQNGTYDIMGNVWEWTETLQSTCYRIRRGGSYFDPGIRDAPSSYIRIDFGQDNSIYDVGFRVASIPEPATLVLFGISYIALVNKRRKQI